MRSHTRGRFAYWIYSEDFDRAISMVTPLFFLLFIVKAVAHYSIIFIADVVLLFCLMKIERKISIVIHKMTTSSSYSFKKPYFLIPIGFVAFALFAIGVILCQFDIVKSQNFLLTYLYTMLMSLSIFMFSAGAKCILVGGSIVSYKLIRRGFFGAFQRVFILIRSLLVTARWVCYFCGTWPIPSLATLVTQPKTNSCLVYIVMKCILLLWLLWDFAFTINAFRINSDVALKPALPEEVVEECVVCMDTPKEPVKLVCGHILCYECAYRWLSTNPTCPFCRHPIAEKKDIEFYDGNMPLSTYFSVF